MMNTVSERR